MAVDLAVRPNTERLRQFFSSVAVSPRCWWWTARINGDGYGVFLGHTASRVSCAWFGGRSVDGLVVDHLCRNTRCVNPAHLEPVANVENVLRGCAYRRANGIKVQRTRARPVGVAPKTFLTMRALADYLGYTGRFAVDSSQRFVARHGLRRYWRSAHCAMVKVSDVDAAIAGAHPFPPGKKTALMRLTAAFVFALCVCAAPSFAQTVDPLTGEWCNPGDCLGPPGPKGDKGDKGDPGRDGRDAGIGPRTLRPFDIGVHGVNFAVRGTVLDGGKVYLIVYEPTFRAAALVDTSTGLAQVVQNFDAGVGVDAQGRSLVFDGVTVLGARAFGWWHHGALWAHNWDETLPWVALPSVAGVSLFRFR